MQTAKFGTSYEVPNRPIIICISFHLQTGPQSTPTSSSATQLWMPHPRCRHSARFVWLLKQRRSSNQINPVPFGYFVLATATLEPLNTKEGISQ